MFVPGAVTLSPSKPVAESCFLESGYPSTSSGHRSGQPQYRGLLEIFNIRSTCPNLRDFRMPGHGSYKFYFKRPAPSETLPAARALPSARIRFNHQLQVRL
jgi:hypothetical protein